MRDILDVQKQLLPDLLEVLNKRYTVLQHIFCWEAWDAEPWPALSI